MAGTILTPGVWGVVATPFAADGSLDTDSLQRLVRHYADIPVTGLTVLGVFGEAAALSRAERDTVLRAVIDAVDLPLVVGLTSLASAPAIEEAAATLEVAGDRVVALMAQVNSPVAAVVRDHFNALTGAAALPIVAQDYPVASGVAISSAALREVVQSADAIAAIKAEAPPTPPAIAELADLGVPIFGGLGGIGLIDELAAGSAGAMTGFSYPEALVDCVAAYAEGGYAAARETFTPYLPLVNFEQQVKIALAVRKECLRVRGLIDCADVRRPAAVLPPSLREQLARHMDYIETRVR